MAAAAPLGPPVVVESGLAAEMIAPTGSSSAGSIAGGRIALGTQHAPLDAISGCPRDFPRRMCPGDVPGGVPGDVPWGCAWGCTLGVWLGFPEVMRVLRSASRHP